MNRNKGSGFFSFFGAAEGTALPTVSCPVFTVERDISFHRSKDCLTVNALPGEEDIHCGIDRSRFLGIEERLFRLSRDI